MDHRNKAVYDGTEGGDLMEKTFIAPAVIACIALVSILITMFKKDS
ncbi:MAG: hypothetical protein U2P59_04175 [Synergistota bacterium]|nr:hypothetical protein [Synergistota bacterium]